MDQAAAHLDFADFDDGAAAGLEHTVDLTEAVGDETAPDAEVGRDQQVGGEGVGVDAAEPEFEPVVGDVVGLVEEGGRGDYEVDAGIEYAFEVA